MLGGMEEVPWNKEYKLQDEHYHAFRIGDLCVVVAKRKSEWYVCTLREQVMPFPEEGERASLSNRELAWQRWEGAGENDTVMIRPALPPMPAISRPEVPVILPPGTKARFFVGIPAFVEVVVNCGSEQRVLLSAPMIKVTFTWKGVDTPSGESKAEGEVCLSLRTRAHRDYYPEKFDPGYIISVIEVSNHKAEPLPFTRMRIDTDYLNVYLAEGRAWTNGFRFNVHDDKSKDMVLYANNPPNEAGEAELIASPRKDHNRKIKKSGAIDSFIDKFRLHI